ncbi:DHHC palmitoyltransferase-domain-containing protein [Collybia nuda]|uniref:Palmitoyltransferase n=1 Tax=Collybia nuda TaxID=64659 RepID=A0A9P5Y4R7_9AGAR|nr:DHHC palmitoyltransferase-domain-containing protein [Collybia nuda]
MSRTLRKSSTSRALPQEHSCCGVIEKATYDAREKRAKQTKGQPWISLKLMVGVTLGIIGYSVYVYIVRFCVKMIQKRRDGGGSRAAGVALLVIFSILLLWTLWAYLKVVLTPPGFARNHIEKTPRPMFPEPPRPLSYETAEYDLETGDLGQRRRYPSSSTSRSHDLNTSATIGGPSYENIPMRRNGDADHPNEGNRPHAQEPNAGVLDALPHPTTKVMATSRKSNSQPLPKEIEKPTPRISRRPPMVPVLLPEHRYCSIDGIVKPYRAHHCRNCGTCVLKYDHHCPWIGQCVGARNHKFFVNFVQAACVFSVYTFATLLGFTIHAVNSLNGDIDPQEIVVIVLAAVFTLFTAPLLLSHIHLILKGQTTVESMKARVQKNREEQALADVFRFWQIREKRRTKQLWNEEWGSIEKDGNIWWLGSSKKGWLDVMGNSRWGWFLPIGRSLSDGLTYPVNPRFDEQGRWRRRVEWPLELR